MYLGEVQFKIRSFEFQPTPIQKNAHNQTTGIELRITHLSLACLCRRQLIGCMQRYYTDVGIYKHIARQ